MTRVIYAFKDQRSLNPTIRLQEVYAPKVVIAHLEPSVHHGALTAISIYSKEVKALLIVNYAGVDTIAKASRFWFHALVVCTANQAL